MVQMVAVVVSSGEWSLVSSGHGICDAVVCQRERVCTYVDRVETRRRVARGDELVSFCQL